MAMPDIGRGGEEVDTVIGREEVQPTEATIPDIPTEEEIGTEEAGREEAEIDALSLLGAYQEDDEGDDDHEREIQDYILEELDEEEDGRVRNKQDETGAVDPDIATLRAQVASLEEKMRVLMSERDAYQMERDIAVMDRDQAIAQR